MRHFLSYTGAGIFLALRRLFPACRISAKLGAVAMPQGVFSLLQTAAIPGRCRVHLVHAEEDILCDWQPNQIERRLVSHRLDYTVVGGSDKWMGTSKHQYLHWLRCQLPLGRHDLTDLKLDTLRSSLSEIGWLRRCGLPLGSALKQSWTDVNGARPLPCWYLPSTFQMMHF